MVTFVYLVRTNLHKIHKKVKMVCFVLESYKVKLRDNAF
jgi:hypothetical protein